MAKNLSWFQARAIAIIEGRSIRRAGWKRWHTYRRSVFQWFTSSPGDTQEEPPLPAIAPRVCTNADHNDRDFLALDWTDEDWNQPPPPPPPIIINPPQPPTTPPTTGTGGTGGTGGPGDGTGDNGGSTGGTGGTGGGWGGPGNPPGPGGNGDPGDGGGGGGIGGGGGGTPPGGDPPPPNDPTPPTALNYTPTLTVQPNPGHVDGPSCYVELPNKVSVGVTVAVPSPQNGTARVATVSVSCLGQTQLGTVGVGASQTFNFEGAPNPGGPIVASATVSIGTGQTWTATNSENKWPPLCVIHTVTWSGTKNIVSRCENPPTSGQPSVTGYDQNDQYATTGTYALNPTPGAQAGQLVPGFGNDEEPGNNASSTVTNYPDGSTSTSEWYQPPPGGINGTVDANGGVSDVTPKFLGIYPTGTNTETSESCSTTTTRNESGPA